MLSHWEDATTGDQQIGGSSDVQWIPAGLPGAGNLLVFDNNQYLFERSPYSFVFQIEHLPDLQRHRQHQLRRPVHGRLQHRDVRRARRSARKGWTTNNGCRTK